MQSSFKALRFSIFIVALILGPAQIQADPRKRSDYETQAQPYLERMYQKATDQWDTDRDGVVDAGSALPADVQKWSPTSTGQQIKTPADPKFWLGNDDQGTFMAPIEDVLVYTLEDFTNCAAFKIKFKWGLKPKAKIQYRWPAQFVHTHPMYQNRYLPYLAGNGPYALGYKNDWAKQFLYPTVESITAPDFIGHAAYEAQWNVRTKWPVFFTTPFPYGVPVPLPSPLIWMRNSPINIFNPQNTTSTVDLAKIDKRLRYAPGKIGNLNVLEYYSSPTVSQIIWFVVTQIWDWLKEIPCTPDWRLPFPVSSDSPLGYIFSRDPLSALLLSGDSKLLNQYLSWLDDPQACVQYMMNKKKTNIPYDMYENPVPVFPDLIKPMPDNKLKSYAEVCIPNWGAVFPYTVTQNLSQYDIVGAGINFLKAIRLSEAMYLTFFGSGSNSSSGTGSGIGDINDLVAFGGAGNDLGDIIKQANSPGGIPSGGGNSSSGNSSSGGSSSSSSSSSGGSSTDESYIYYFPYRIGKDKLQYTFHDQAPLKCRNPGDPGLPNLASNTTRQKKDHYGLYTIVHWFQQPSCRMSIGDAFDFANGLLSFDPTSIDLNSFINDLSNADLSDISNLSNQLFGDGS